MLLPADRVLDLDETDFLESLSVQASVAIENARFHARALQWQRVESDLAAARQVQLSLVPQEMPEIPSYGLAARSVTCYEVGGDYLDIVSMPSGETVIVVGDVAGKGLASALVGASFRSAIPRHGPRGPEPAGDCHQHEPAALWRRRRGPPPLCHRHAACGWTPRRTLWKSSTPAITPPSWSAADGTLDKIKASGTPIGLLPFSSYRARKSSFNPGTRLLVYTDGMTEVFHGEDEFGEDRLLRDFLACNEPPRSGCWVLSGDAGRILRWTGPVGRYDRAGAVQEPTGDRDRWKTTPERASNCSFRPG